MISRTAEYAVRAALWLVRHRGRPSTVREIAEDTAVPGGYLAKILRALGRAGLVRAQPGPGGGFLLSREPEAVSVLDVIDAADPIHRVEGCPLGLPEHAETLCPFHARLDEALAHTRNAFANCTLAELVAESDASGLFCSRTVGCGQGSQLSKSPCSNNGNSHAKGTQP
ncbi:MAG: Rrf2 family transcriptional regulator [Phycisphaerales bacterium]|nr:Rrf2 family transcriptional regulator [Phycisphaerales bacterium]